MSDPNLTTSESNDAPLSLSEGVTALMGTPEAEEPKEGQPEAEDAPEGEAEDDELPPDDPEGEDDAEGEPDEEGQAEDGDEEETTSDQGRFVSPNGKVTLPDGTVSTVADLIQGNLRDRDYRQKTMAHADEVKAFRAQSEAVAQQEQRITQQAEYITGLINSIVPAAPDPALADPRSPAYDPATYIAQKAQREQWIGHLQYLDQQRQQSEQERQAKAEQDSKTKIETEWARAVEKLPELKDATRLEAFGNDLLKYGAEFGYSRDEIAKAPYDHRQLLVLKKAIAWEKLQARKAKNPPANPAEKRPPVVRGGKRLNPGQSAAREANAAMERLNKSGKLADGVAAYLATQSKG